MKDNKPIDSPQPQFKVGDRVLKNELTWQPNDFDAWGRGLGIGLVVEPPFPLDEGEVDVRWPKGRCFEYCAQLKKLDEEAP